MSQDRRNELAEACREKLLAMKTELMNRARHLHNEFKMQDKRGDEIDLTVAQIEEDHFLLNQDRVRKQLLEIEWALARIQSGEFGVCEETHEPIEAARLLALPFTRLSIEGAEIRERQQRKISR